MRVNPPHCDSIQTDVIFTNFTVQWVYPKGQNVKQACMPSPWPLEIKFVPGLIHWSSSLYDFCRPALRKQTMAECKTSWDYHWFRGWSRALNMFLYIIGFVSLTDLICEVLCFLFFFFFVDLINDDLYILFSDRLDQYLCFVSLIVWVSHSESVKLSTFYFMSLINWVSHYESSENFSVFCCFSCIIISDSKDSVYQH